MKDLVNENIVVGFFTGVIATFVVFMVLTFDNSAASTVKCYQHLREANISITISNCGDFYLWDEKTRTSIPISTETLRAMSSHVK